VNLGEPKEGARPAQGPSHPSKGFKPQNFGLKKGLKISHLSYKYII